MELHHWPKQIIAQKIRKVISGQALSITVLETLEERKLGAAGMDVSRMGTARAKIRTVEDIYRSVWAAVASKGPIEARYKRYPRLLCPHRWGRNREGNHECCATNTVGKARGDCSRQVRRLTGVVWRWEAQSGEAAGGCMAHRFKPVPSGILRYRRRY